MRAMLRRFDCSEAVAGSNFPALKERSEVRGIVWNFEGLALANCSSTANPSEKK
jgi:hypothetical protein